MPSEVESGEHWYEKISTAGSERQKSFSLASPLRLV
jgi:hypothetical protein